LKAKSDQKKSAANGDEANKNSEKHFLKDLVCSPILKIFFKKARVFLFKFKSGLFSP